VVAFEAGGEVCHILQSVTHCSGVEVIVGKANLVHQPQPDGGGMGVLEKVLAKLAEGFAPARSPVAEEKIHLIYTTRGSYFDAPAVRLNLHYHNTKSRQVSPELCYSTSPPFASKLMLPQTLQSFNWHTGAIRSKMVRI